MFTCKSCFISYEHTSSCLSGFCISFDADQREGEGGGQKQKLHQQRNVIIFLLSVADADKVEHGWAEPTSSMHGKSYFTRFSMMHEELSTHLRWHFVLKFITMRNIALDT